MTMPYTKGPTRRENTPLYAIIAIGLLLAFTLCALIFVPPQNNTAMITFVGLVITTIPSLIAAAFAERVSRDVRNGVMEEKAKMGAHAALQESGVTAVAQSSQASTTAALTALTKLLEKAQATEEAKQNAS